MLCERLGIPGQCTFLLTAQREKCTEIRTAVTKCYLLIVKHYHLTINYISIVTVIALLEDSCDNCLLHSDIQNRTRLEIACPSSKNVLVSFILERCYYVCHARLTYKKGTPDNRESLACELLVSICIIVPNKIVVVIK